MTSHESIKPGTLIVDDLVPEDREEPLFPESPLRKQCMEAWYSFKFNINDNPSIFMLVFKGKWPSNNWLKMHGFPMRRRCGLKMHGYPMRRRKTK